MSSSFSPQGNFRIGRSRKWADFLVVWPLRLATGREKSVLKAGALALIARRFLSVAVVALLVAGCAGTPGEQSEDLAGDSESESEFGFGGPPESENDPLETPNRLIFAMNEMLDVVLLQPAAASYRFLLPDGLRDSVRNFMRNLRSPVVLANDVFQGDEQRVETTFKRFLINSTLGIGGLFDPAESMGYPYHNEDFGQTLGTYDVGEGFYLVLPIFGPSSARDGVGLIVDILMDPLTYLLNQELQLARFAIEGVDKRSRNIETVEEIKRDSVDFYARVRSLYRQHRQNEINNGEFDENIPVPGLGGNEIQSSSMDWLE